MEFSAALRIACISMLVFMCCLTLIYYTFPIPYGAQEEDRYSWFIIGTRNTLCVLHPTDCGHADALSALRYLFR
jgi:hypothetical protein